MKRMMSLVLATMMFVSTTAFAGNSNVRALVRNYHVDVRVNNIDAQIAIESMIESMIEAKITKEELMDYVKAQLTSEEFATFSAIVANGQEEMANFESMDSSDFRFVFDQALSASSLNTGANYAGCGALVGLGFTAAMGGMVLAFLAIDAGTRRRNGPLVFDRRDSERARELGVAASIAGGVGFILSMTARFGC